MPPPPHQRRRLASYPTRRRADDTGKLLSTWTASDHIPRQGEFKWQHDAQLHAGSTVTLFDDHCCDITGADTYLPATGPARGLTLNLDQVTAWRVLSVAADGTTQTLATHKRTEFETSVPVAGGARRFRVEALDASAQVLGTSKTFGASG